MFDMLLSRVKETLWPGSEAIALPTMDGPLKPNRRLEDASVLGDPIEDCDDAVAIDGGAVIVSAGSRLHRLSGEGLASRGTWFESSGRIGALASNGPVVYAAVAGQGVVRIESGRVTATLATVDGQPLRCVTALAVLPDGRIAIAEGSRFNGIDAWTRDLLEKRASGRLVVAAADFSKASTLLSDLAWPSGVIVQGGVIWYSEAWRYRVQAVALAGGAPRTVIQHLPGYPGRLARDTPDGVWLTVFAVRTLLIEFVLREKQYREAMLATVAPEFWIAPAYRATGHYLEPLQGGSIKKLGIVKPWAPPRSYGLVVRVSGEGEILDSLHSRVGGVNHGITSVLARDAHLLALSRGSGRVLSCDTERAS